jgi:hypothetical protein
MHGEIKSDPLCPKQFRFRIWNKPVNAGSGDALVRRSVRSTLTSRKFHESESD